MTGIYHPDDRHASRQPGWKAYQERLKQRQRPPAPNRKKIQRNRPDLKFTGLLKITGLLIVLLVLVGGLFLYPKGGAEVPPAETPPAAASPKLAARIQKSDLRILLGQNHLTNVTQQPVQVVFDGHPYKVRTSLDMGLQQYLLDNLDRVNSRYIGIVAMQPQTGRLITMVGFDKQNPAHDPCVCADYPAASLFKIVTAAAAVEKKGYTAGTNLKFNGYKHTLYKRQLTDTTNRYTISTTLEDAFAQSINPVFGKIGALYIDPAALKAVGDALGFNREMNFDLPWPVSHLEIDDDTYHRAEIASGFNRETTLSPLHGAVIVATMINGGKPVEPTLVDQIVDDRGNSIYRGAPHVLPPAVSAGTATQLQRMMEATITSGTGRRAFRGHGKSAVLSRLTLGGKTGSISNQANDTRFDWFAGFATEKNGSEKLAIAVMVGHGEYIGTRAGHYARMAFEYYFKEYFAQKEPVGGASNS